MVLGPLGTWTRAVLAPGLVLTCKEGQPHLIISPLPGSQQSLLVTSPRVTEVTEEKLKFRVGWTSQDSRPSRVTQTFGRGRRRLSVTLPQNFRQDWV